MKSQLIKALSVAALISTSFLASTEVMAERTLRLSLQVNTKHPVGANIVYFKEQVEKASNGDLKIEVYDSAQLYKGSEIPQAVGSGAIDMGLVLISEYAGTIPAVGLFSVAFMFPSYDYSGPQFLDTGLSYCPRRTMAWQQVSERCTAPNSRPRWH